MSGESRHAASVQQAEHDPSEPERGPPAAGSAAAAVVTHGPRGRDGVGDEAVGRAGRAIAVTRLCDVAETGRGHALGARRNPAVARTAAATAPPAPGSSASTPSFAAASELPDAPGASPAGHYGQPQEYSAASIGNRVSSLKKRIHR